MEEYKFIKSFGKKSTFAKEIIVHILWIEHSAELSKMPKSDIRRSLFAVDILNVWNTSFAKITILILSFEN